jgi:hypothetical protein
VYIFVAAAALRILDLKQSVFAFGDMARFAFDLSVASLERIAGRRMLFQAEKRRLESIHGMTPSAITASSACLELPPVVIGVAIAARIMCYRALKISPRMAFAARHGAVLSEQRKCSLVVIKTLELRDARPTRGAVA